MPNRMLKDSINESRGLTSCSFFAQDLYKRLITYADDYGRFNADPQIMLARLYPRELAVVLLEDLMDGLIELAGVGKIQFYTSQPRSDVYGAFPNWKDHQRIRESKKKAPDPDDTTVNDWYYRRFIPMEMKIAVIQRDEYKCQICGKHLWVGDPYDAHKFAKMGEGLFHIDHVVPVNQGGRATLENLRLTCPKCNLSRKKSVSFDEVLQFAANRRELPQVAANRVLKPNQSETKTETSPNPKDNARAARFTPPTVEQVAEYAKEKGYAGFNADRFCDFYASKGWKVGKDTMKDWQAAVRGWAARDKENAPRNQITTYKDVDWDKIGL